ncbi:hypothetical protein NXS19_004310 [Fusarium pseudograminearum]|nr:hypothetical protein NXS19_004310 [Fusarium pseudograminearum]
MCNANKLRRGSSGLSLLHDVSQHIIVYGYTRSRCTQDKDVGPEAPTVEMHVDGPRLCAPPIAVVSVPEECLSYFVILISLHFVECDAVSITTESRNASYLTGCKHMASKA